MSTNDSIKVGIKVRPLLSKERDSVCWRVLENTIGLEGSQSEPYRFDHVFDQNASNEIIFDKMAKHIVQAALQGFNGTIFAYGQTSSGKTYTMMGAKNDPGVMVLAAQEIFSEIEKASDTRQFLLRGGFIEIYNEKIFDLLNRTNQDLKIHETNTGNVSVNCEEVGITSEKHLLELLDAGNKTRTVGETNMNERSSRSHAIFRLIIESRDITSEDGNVTQGLLHLVDLAGSERADQTGARGPRLIEGGHINKSLLFLSTVIKRLSENSEDGKFINFRDSKLTRILQASLGGNAFTSIICTVKPTALEETQSTLNFATRAKSVKNKPHVNEIVSDAAMLKRMERAIKDLKKELEEERRKNISQIKVAEIEEMIGSKELMIISSTSLHQTRNLKENRRRTWCPNSDNILSPPTVQSSNVFKPETNSISRIKPPSVFLTPHVILRNPNSDYSNNVKMETVHEEFVPAECFNFDKVKSSISPETTTSGNEVNEDTFLKISLSPSNRDPNLHIKKLEQELQSLQEFINFESKIGVEHDLYKNLEEKYHAVCKRKDELEEERLEYLHAKHDVSLIREQCHEVEICCTKLKSEIEILKQSNEDLNKKIQHKDNEITSLRSKITVLENENCESVSLQYQFEQERDQARTREKELLELIADKENEIIKLQNQPNSIRLKKLSLSKVKRTQFTLSTDNETSENEHDFEICNSENLLKSDENVCINCEDLQRILNENKNVAYDFQKLKQQYTELQLNYEASVSDLLNTQQRLAEIEGNFKNGDDECKKLYEEIAQLNEKLESIEKENILIKTDRDEKSELCETLKQKVEASQQELIVLREKYATLEFNFENQKTMISSIRSEYDAVATKYNELKSSYEKLEQNSTKCGSDCERLIIENDMLQNEIQNLRTRVESIKQQLLKDATIVTQEKEDISKESITLSEMRSKNLKLEAELAELQAQFGQLQQENDQLSTNIMENLHDNDVLTKNYENLETQLTALKNEQNLIEEDRLKWISEKQSLERQIEELKQKIDTSQYNLLNDNLEMGSLKIKLEKTENERSNLESDKEKLTEEITVLRTKIENESVLNINNSSITESSRDLLFNETEKLLRREISDLQYKNNELQTQNESILATSQRVIQELREEVVRISKELFEKSMAIENCSCIEFQRQNDSNRSGLKISNEKLFEKRGNNSNGLSSSMDNGRSSLDNKTLCFSTTLPNEVMESYNEAKSENDIELLRSELRKKETDYQNLQLEMLEKLNLAETRFRENLKKYNDDWETNRLKYETKINQLEMKLFDRQNDFNDDAELQSQNGLDDSSWKAKDIKSEYDKNSTYVERYENCSTPTTSPLSSSRVFEMRKSSEKRAQTVKECNQQISLLSDVIEKSKSFQVELSEALAEKTKLLEEKDSQIAQMKSANLKVKRESRKSNELNTNTDSRVLNALSEKEVEIKNLKILLEEVEEQGQIKVNELEDLCEHLRLESDDLKERLQSSNDLIDKVSEKENEITQLKAKIDALQKECECLLTEKVETLAETTNLKEQLSEREKDLDNLNISTQGAMQELEIEIENLKKVCEQLRAEKLSSENELSELISEKNERKEENNELREQLSTAAKNKELIEKELEQTKQLAMDVEKTAIVQKETLNIVIEKRDALQTELQTLTTKTEETKIKLNTQVTNLMQELEECKLERSTNLEKIETMNLKLDSLEQELHESKRSSENLTKILSDFEALEKQFELLSTDRTELEWEVLKLQEELNEYHTNSNKDSQTQKDQFEIIEKKLHETQAAYDSAVEQTKTLDAELKKLQLDSEEEQSSLKHKLLESQSQLGELRLKYNELQVANGKLEALNNELNGQLNEAKTELDGHLEMRELCTKLGVEIFELEAQIQEMHAETEKSNKDYQSQLQKRIEEHDELNSLLETKQKYFEDTKQKLESTISCLQNENKNLLERVETISEILKKSVDTTESANNSLELSAHSTTSSILRRSPNQLAANINGDDITSVINKERKNRRSTTHDENRRQSAKFVPILSDVGTMTDPIPVKCDCEENVKTFTELKTQLYIKQSQVTALTIDLRNHPLKNENAELIKRIQAEQEKSRLLMEKYKKKISEKESKLQELLDQINNIKSAKVVTLESCTMTHQTQVIAKQTQTDSDIDVSLQKLQVKYNDLKNICRHRYNHILDLKKQLNEKENVANIQNEPTT